MRDAASAGATRRTLPSGAAAATTLVIGYGSPIRGDDAIGPLAAERLAAGPLPEGVRVCSRHLLTAELACDLAGVDRVVFLDATVDGEPGEVRVRELAADPGLTSTMAHDHDPRELLAWCAALYGRTPQAFLVTAAGATFDYASYRLSAPAQSAVDRMLAETRRLIGTPRPSSQPPPPRRMRSR
jgi:hydrogenase maturation protease